MLESESLAQQIKQKATTAEGVGEIVPNNANWAVTDQCLMSPIRTDTPDEGVLTNYASEDALTT